MSDTQPVKANLLIVDDEREHAQVMCEALQRLGHKCDVTYSLSEARQKLDRRQYDVVVTDLMMEGRKDGLEVMAAAKKQNPPPPVILVTAHGAIRTYKEAMSLGAFDFIEKPLDLEDFRAQVNRAAIQGTLQRQNQLLQEQVSELGGDRSGFEAIIGTSAAMRNVVNTARRVANSDIPVLILGESGTGKELVARAIHLASERKKGRLVILNCAGFAPTILEDELFGHVKGAFTDARTDREGRFEHADNGTLFLDEIGDMPADMQAKLLRALENGEVVRLGSNDPIKVDVRLISATNKPLEQMTLDRSFREDLYYRINGISISIPPLRERREDIPLLIHYFVQQAAEKLGKQIDGVEPDAHQKLMSYGWPGNVRQLRRAIERMVVLSTGSKLTADTLPPEIHPMTPTEPVAGMGNLVGISLEQAEIELIRNTLKLTNGNREQAAKILNIGERTLYRKIKEYNL